MDSGYEEVKLFTLLGSREQTLWQQLKMLRKAFLFFTFERDSKGFIWILRLPLFMVMSKKNWWSYVQPGHRVSGGLVGFWPNLPLHEGGFIYRWQKGWFE